MAALLLVPALAYAENGVPEHTPPTVHGTQPSPEASDMASPGPHNGTPIRPGGPDVTPSSSPSASPGAGHNPAMFCTNLTSTGSQISSNTSGRFGQLQTALGQGKGKIKSDMGSIGQSLAAARANADAKRKQDFAMLTAKATTPADQAAVAAFEASVNHAIATNRATVDAANATFEQGLLAAISARQSQLAGAAATYKAAVAAALASAKSSCSAGDDPATVRADLMSALTNARDNFQAAQKVVENNSPSIKTLETTRQAAVSAANTTLKAAIHQALATLEAALGVDTSPSPSPTPNN